MRVNPASCGEEVFRAGQIRDNPATESGKLYAVPKHPKSPMSLAEINRWLGSNIRCIGAEECTRFMEFYQHKVVTGEIDQTSRVPIFFEMEKTGGFGAYDLKELKYAQVEAFTAFGDCTLLGSDGNGFLVLRKNPVLDTYVIESLSAKQAAKRLSVELELHAPGLRNELRQHATAPPHGE